MTTQTYKNTKITFPTADDPYFSARINDKTVRTASFDAIKKRIDATKSFQPFDAITQDRNNKWMTVRVVGIAKPISRRDSPTFEIEGDQHLSGWQSLYKPEDRTKVEQLTRDAEKQGKIAEAARTERGKLYDQLRGLQIKPTATE